MSKNITIIDPQYKEWIKELSLRYRKSQIKAAVKVNSEMLKFYWSLGYDIVQKKAEAQWGSKFYKNLSADLKHESPDATCFSETNLKYMKYFYEMFPATEIRPQLVDETQAQFSPQVEDEIHVEQFSPQLVDELDADIFAVPWGHYRLLIDKYKTQPQKALFLMLIR